MEVLSKAVLVCIFATFVITCCVGKDETITGGRVQCKVLGQSGKIRLVYIGNETQGNFSDNNKNQLTFEVDEIAELDAQGNEVGKRGPAANKHSLNSLATQDFAFSNVDRNAYYQGIKVINVNLTANLSGPHAILRIMIFLFLEDGNVTFGNESFAVFRGTVKFNIKIEDWEFCDPPRQNCRGQGQSYEEGAAIKLTLAIKSKGTPKKMSKEERGRSKKKPFCFKKKEEACPRNYDMGGGSEVLLNKEILLDGESVDMPDPFPKFEVKGNKNLFVFRIPRFNNTALIDPTANMDGIAGDPISEGGGGGGGGGGDGDGDKNSSPVLLFNMLVLVVLLHAAIMFTVFF